MSLSDHRLIAYLDGELPDAERPGVEAALAADPDLRARAEAHRSVGRRTRETYAPVLDEPIPDPLLRLIESGGGPRRVVLSGWSPMQIGAVAAALVIGVAVGGPLLQAVAPRPALSSSSEAVWAGGELARALEQDPAARVDDPRPVRVGLTFRSREGRWCRTFTTRDGGGMAGVACRDDGAWQVAMTARTPRTPETEMRTAASDTPTPVLEMVDQMIAGDVLDAAAEKATLERRWR